MTSALRIGIDLGGTGTRIVLVAEDGSIVERLSYATAADLASAVPELLAAVRRLADGASPVVIGIGASGPVDRDGVIRNPETLPGFTGTDLRGVLGAEFGVPVAIDNDAVAAAVYEANAGEGRGADSVLIVTLGTGVGVAALAKGRPVRGADGEHPEAGHRFVAVPTTPCYCGRPACWEQAVSRSALERTAVDVLGGDSPPSGALAALAARARDGESAATAVFEAFGHELGAGLADIETVFRADTIVVGGSVAQFADLLTEPVRRSFSQIETYRPAPAIRYSRAGDLGGAVGAALLDPNWY